jgi:hypothetical protein
MHPEVILLCEANRDQRVPAPARNNWLVMYSVDEKQSSPAYDKKIL